MTRDQGAGLREQGSTLRAAGVVLLLGAAFALGGWAAPWWGVAVIAAAAALGRVATPGKIALGAGLGWGALLALGAARAPVGKLAAMLGALLHTPAAVLVLLTVLFPALLAWSAAATVRRGDG